MPTSHLRKSLLYTHKPVNIAFKSSKTKVYRAEKVGDAVLV